MLKRLIKTNARVLNRFNLSLIFILLTVLCSGQLRLKKLDVACDVLRLKVSMGFSYGGSSCPDLYQYDFERMGDTVVLNLYYDANGGWQDKGCEEIDTLIEPLEPGIVGLRAYSWEVIGTQYNQLDIERMSLCGSGTSIDENISTQFTIGPNPFDDQFEIGFNRSLLPGEKVIIYNALGEVVVVKENIETDNRIDTTVLPSGVYYVSVGGGPRTKAIKW